MSNSSLKALENERSFNAALRFFSFWFYKGRCGNLIILCCELVLCPERKGKKLFYCSIMHLLLLFMLIPALVQ